ncbi:MAG: hypothetical protein ACKV2U_05440 [Bryobacteraceae bacterium]
MLLLLLPCFYSGCTREDASSPAPATDNSVVAFLNNAERQSETDHQRKEIQRALSDMLDKSPAELRQMRYQDYAGQANAWSITQLLRHYFVPDPPVALDERRFFEDVPAPAARAAIQRKLDEVARAIQ